MIRGRVNVALELHRDASANTYRDHPWPGWDAFSADFWGGDGRGAPISRRQGDSLYRYFLARTTRQQIRHIIYRHTLWTPWGGEQRWERDDHSGELRHIHVTWYPIS